MKKCQLCPNTDDLHEIESMPWLLCGNCWDKLVTHIAVVCTGCNTLHWLLKTPGNVMAAAELSGLEPLHIRDNYMIHQISKCKQCYEPARDFMVETKWTQ